MADYDPFRRGPHPAGVRTLEARDAARGRVSPIEVWYPATAAHAGQDLAPETRETFAVAPDDAPRAQDAVRDAAASPGPHALVAFSHGSGRGARRMSTFLCTHLASHGYVVAALDHFEVIATDMARRPGEAEEERAARAEAWIANRVPDIRFLLDHLLTGGWDSESRIDPRRVGIVGYSFGGWTALAATEVEWRIRAVVALAPGGSSNPKPGILAARLGFAWGREVPALYLAGEDDVMTPLAGIRELVGRTPGKRQLVVLRGADHLHFMDDVEREHEAARTMAWPPNLAWIGQEMRPIGELVSGAQAHLFARGLIVAHMDMALREDERARAFLSGDLRVQLARRGVEVLVPERVTSTMT